MNRLLVPILASLLLPAVLGCSGRERTGLRSDPFLSKTQEGGRRKLGFPFSLRTDKGPSTASNETGLGDPMYGTLSRPESLRPTPQVADSGPAGRPAEPAGRPFDPGPGWWNSGDRAPPPTSPAPAGRDPLFDSAGGRPASPAESPSGDRFAGDIAGEDRNPPRDEYSRIRHRLNRLGVRQFRWQTEPNSQEGLFRCVAPYPNDPNRLRVFEARDPDMLRAMLAVTLKIEKWYGDYDAANPY